jgi:hypothetical protein
MILDGETTNEISEVFKGVYKNRDTAKELTSSASNIMKGLAAWIAERSGEDKKVIRKSLDKAYKEWASDKEGEPDSLSDALLVINAVVPHKE